MTYESPPIIIGITGASGAIYGIRTLEILKALNIPTILVLSKSSSITVPFETGYNLDQVRNLATKYYSYQDFTSPIASGSFKTQGMVIAPCSVKTLSGISNSYEDNLIIRAASVTLKERRRLVALFRETPLHLSHIENMSKVTNMGGIIFPPIPAFYNHPNSINELIDHSIGRILDLFNIETTLVKRWIGFKR